jgi:hypothetical protein
MVLPRRYNRDQIFKAIKNPEKIVSEFKYLYHSSKFRYKYRNERAINPLNEDWDNLFILDACRYDIFEEINPFDEKVDYRILQSSNSPEFCDAYISGNKYHDTIYVTANPFGIRVDNKSFYRKYSTIDENGNDPNVNWAPEAVYQLALESYRSNLDKRLMVHFMQPHAPYFGDKAAQLRESIKEEGYQFWAWNEKLSQENKDRDDVITHLLSAAQRGVITPDELIEVYTENLEIILEYIQKLVDEVDGKTVITSDHGEMLRWKIGHGREIYTEELRKVPWLVLPDDDGNRREITAETPSGSQEVVDSEIDNQLRALGYK